MPDLYLTNDGDLAIDSLNDIGVTQSSLRESLQQAYVRIMTEVGDWLNYSDLGCDLNRLYGMPQSETTGLYGIQLIKAALLRDGYFTNSVIDIQAIPISLQVIRFDIYIKVLDNQQVKLSIHQELQPE